MSSITQLIGTIIQLQNLRANQEAQQLARERFGLEQQQTQAGLTGSLLGSLPGYADPSAFVGQNVEELSGMTGASPELLTSAAAQTPPSVQTTRAGAVQRGARQAGTSLDAPAASGAIAGALPGGLAEDFLQDTLIRGETSYFNSLPDSRRQHFLESMLTRTATGMPVGQAALDEAITGLSPEERAQAIKVGKGLAPSASEDAQLRQGYLEFKNLQKYQQTSLALDELRVKGALMQHSQELGAQAMKEANDLLANKMKAQQDAVRTSSTLTPAGLEQYRALINGYNAQLRRLAPQVFGKGGEAELVDIPAGQSTASSVMQQFMSGPKFP